MPMVYERKTTLNSHIQPLFKEIASDPRWTDWKVIYIYML